MEPNNTGFSEEKRSENDNRKSQIREPAPKVDPIQPRRKSIGQRWNSLQLSKTAVFWVCLAMIAGTMIVGFRWGGWVTGATAQQDATSLANDAVVQRLTSICIAQFQQDPTKEEKIAELLEARSTQQRSFVEDQGWATMPGDEQADTKVVRECAAQLAQLNAE